MCTLGLFYFQWHLSQIATLVRTRGKIQKNLSIYSKLKKKLEMEIQWFPSMEITRFLPNISNLVGHQAITLSQMLQNTFLVNFIVMYLQTFVETHKP
jgi:DNA-binding SARP family transcriptional activator